MSAPKFVPSDGRPTYESPPIRVGSARSAKPGAVAAISVGGQRLGQPGPDAGFALLLAHKVAGRFKLSAGEHLQDAQAGAAAIAARRAALFGRAPVITDMEVALAAWCFDSDGDPELVAIRRAAFSEISHPHRYEALRVVAESVPEATLLLSPDEVRAQAQSSWRSVLEPMESVR